MFAEHGFCHEQPHNQHWGQDVRITFQVKSQGHRVNKFKQITNYWLQIVHINIHTYIIKHLEQNVVKGQDHSTNALKLLFFAQMFISCHIADFNVF